MDKDTFDKSKRIMGEIKSLLEVRLLQEDVKRILEDIERRLIFEGSYSEA